MSSRPETTLSLYLAIIVLGLLSRYMVGLDISMALFACFSMPASYALAYYKALVEKTFIKSGERAPVARVFIYELAGLLLSYFLGFIVYAALVDAPDLWLFTSAFIACQVMRLLISSYMSLARSVGVDTTKPAVILGTAVVAAIAGLITVVLLLGITST